MLAPSSDDGVVVVDDRLVASVRRVARRTDAQIYRAWCSRDGPCPLNGRGGAREGDSVVSVNVTFFSSHHLRYRFRAQTA